MLKRENAFLRPSAPQIIGIAGGTASGKSTLAEAISQETRFGPTALIYLDSYYRDQANVPFEERVKVNYDHPSAYDLGPLLSHLDLLQRGEGVEIPVYDFTQHTRAAHRISVSPAPLIIVEGILSLHSPQLSNRFALKIFVDTPDPVRLERRLERDVRERGRTPEEVHARWQSTVQPMFREFCYPTKDCADLVLDGQQPIQELTDRVFSAITGNASCEAVLSRAG